MPLFSTIAAKSATTVINNLAKWGFNKLTAQKASGFEAELQKIITTTVAEYDQKFPIPETNQIPFYSSQAFFDLLLQFRFTKQIDQAKVDKILRSNPLIIPPTDNQLTVFFEIFDAKINASTNLARLNLDVNFKEEIFNISRMLRGFRDEVVSSILELKQDIKSSERSAVLVEEWNKQIDEIYQSVNHFKPISALGRLATLEQRIQSESITNDKLFARISYIHASCLIQCEQFSQKAEIAERLIRAYKLQPANADYKAHAGLAYVTVGEIEKGLPIAESILRTDEYDPSGWLIKILAANKEFPQVLSVIPPTVKAKRNFQLRLYQWLNSNHYIDKTAALDSFGIHIQLDPNEPLVVTSHNLQSWLIKALYLLNAYYEKSSHINTQLADNKAKDDANFQRGINILRAIYAAVQGTEMEAFLANYWFELFAGEFILTSDDKHISEMEKWFPRVQPRRPITVIRMYQAFNSLRTREGILKACRMLEENLSNEEPELYYLAAVSYDFLRDAANGERNFLLYVHAQKPVPWQSMVNILLFLRRAKITFGETGMNELKTLVNEGTFASPIYKDLLAIALYFRFQIGLAPEELPKRTEQVAANLDPTDLDLYLTIVYAWCTLQEFEKAKEYLESLISFKEESEGLKLYCKILYSIDGHKPRLLDLLQHWRQHFSPEPELAQIELHLYELARNWKDLTIVSQWAITQWPDNEKSIYLLFKALYNSLDLEGIVYNAPLVQGRLFMFSYFVPLICVALLKASLYQEALELLYQHARIKENIACRQAYLTSTINFPEGYFVDYPEVAVGSYVVYQIGGNRAILEVTTSNQHNFPAKYLLGRKAGESFGIPVPITDAFEQVTILRVCNQYMSLFQEILFDTENPLSGLGIQAFKLEGNKAENLSRKLIETFGATGTLERDRLHSELEKYYDGQISFSEVTNSVFRRHPVDAYFVLSDKKSKNYKGISPAVSRNILLKADDKFILDFTSLCLFYELSQELSIPFSTIFVVSRYTREVLVNLLQEAKDSPQAEYSISITQEKVIPHFYAPNFKENRIQQIQSIMDWVDTHCKVEQAEQTLDYIVASTNGGGMDPYLLSLLENRLLVNQSNCYLLSNDIMYYRHMNTGTDKCLSPICYLSSYPPEELDLMLDFMLQKNYIGIPIRSFVLTRELFKMLSDQSNKFIVCIENLRSNWNPDPENVAEALKFVKSLYSSAVLAPSTRQHIVSLVLSSLIVGISVQRLRLIQALLTAEFKMMGKYLNEVLALYLVAIRSRNEKLSY